MNRVPSAQVLMPNAGCWLPGLQLHFVGVQLPLLSMHAVALQVKAAEGEEAEKVGAPKKPKKANDLIGKVLPLDEFEKAVAELKPVLPNVVYIHATGVLIFTGFKNLFCPGPNCHKYCKSKGCCAGRDPCSPALPPGFS